ncbi:hypothetical protein GBL_2714 [Geobacillus kaustophilus GBlys]|uniref:Uncharacterized protein n=2 Tax=Geobacillus TaxID=129337 RepID=A0A7U9JC91_GEOTM|nr:hypothetical protein GA8_06150 [Geobacillus sp. A8]ESU72848.1 hypothetical protein T260_05950 [Geobacillus sp. MAS1]GAD14497.1 hypothetical protein GBL_2714 [Geobacillus kaustophilus GBlys]
MYHRATIVGERRNDQFHNDSKKETIDRQWSEKKKQEASRSSDEKGSASTKNEKRPA